MDFLFPFFILPAVCDFGARRIFLYGRSVAIVDGSSATLSAGGQAGSDVVDTGGALYVGDAGSLPPGI